MLKSLFVVPAPLFPTIITSKTALMEVGGLDEKVVAYQEWDTSIALAHLCKFEYIEEPVFIYNLHFGETISNSKKRDFFGYKYIVDKYSCEILSLVGREALEKHY